MPRMLDYAAIINRAIELLTNPRRAFRVIRDETVPGRSLILRYTLVLAAVPTVCSFLGQLSYGLGFGFSLLYSALMLGVYLGTMFLIGPVVNAMAPSFGTVRNENAAYKLMIYGVTPVWVAGVLTLFPGLSILALLAGFGYSVYLVYQGCRILMDTPEEKAIAFSLAAIGVLLVATVIAGIVVEQIIGSAFVPPAIVHAGKPIPIPH
ncbi:MAG: YIP1 family protein [Myxococcales bacterium]|nr:YIP1 family protein [Myxococcales bacterium]